MHMGRIEAAEEIQLNPQARPERGNALLGMAFLLMTIPYWILRLVGGALWRDLLRIARFAKLAGETYGEALKR